MNELIEMLRQVLEALEEARNALYEGHPVRTNTQKAIAALRERLGEGEQQGTNQQKGGKK